VPPMSKRMPKERERERERERLARRQKSGKRVGTDNPLDLGPLAREKMKERRLYPPCPPFA
jgi:hypothetical protein